MTMRVAIVAVLSVFGLVAIGPAAAIGANSNNSSSAGSKPHIILMVLDDLGHNDVGFHNSRIRSPYLDSLAAQGTILDNYYVFRFCSPSRSTFMTGRYPYHIGQQTEMNLNPMPGIACGINLAYKFLPDVLAKAGYQSYALGKWHLGFLNNSYTPTYRGFKSYLGYYSGAEEHFTHEKAGFGINEFDLANNTGAHVAPASRDLVGPNGLYSVYLYGNESIRYIMNHDTSVPMFMYLAWNVVHEPCEAPQTYFDQYNGTIVNTGRRYFAAMMTAMDDSLRQVVAALKTKQMYDNTILVVTTDNGGNLGGSGNNYPLRGGKYTFWEGGVNGIGFIHSPLLPAAMRGQHWSGLAHAADWYTTFAKLAGADTGNTGPVAVDGVALWDAITTNASSPRDNVIVNVLSADENGKKLNQTSGAIIRGEYKLIIGYPGWGKKEWDGWPTVPDEEGLYDPSYDYAAMPPKGDLGNYPGPKPCEAAPCLFNLRLDRTEHNDIAAGNPEIVQRLTAEFVEAAKSEVSVAASGLCPTSYGVKSDPRCKALAQNTGFWQPWL